MHGGGNLCLKLQVERAQRSLIRKFDLAREKRIS